MRVWKHPATSRHVRRQRHLRVAWAPKLPAAGHWTWLVGAGMPRTAVVMRPSCARWWSSATERNGSAMKLQRALGGERTEIVDWWHAAEHIWDLSKALHGQGTPQADTWADHAKHVLWRHGPVPLLRLLRETVAPNADACKILQRERGYFSANALRMQYPLFRQQGLPVGSGAVESGAKHLVQQRMKRAGMRWNELGARAILHLRCQTLSATTPDRSASVGVESGAGAVAVRSGAVHASSCRRCGPETVLRFQSPLINPGMPFSSTRLSEVLHRTAVCAAVYHLTVGPENVYVSSLCETAATSPTLKWVVFAG
jgi:hypothetical protein